MATTAKHAGHQPDIALKSIQKRIAARFGSTPIAWQAVQKATANLQDQKNAPSRAMHQGNQGQNPPEGKRVQGDFGGPLNIPTQIVVTNVPLHLDRPQTHPARPSRTHLSMDERQAVDTEISPWPDRPVHLKTRSQTDPVLRLPHHQFPSICPSSFDEAHPALAGEHWMRSKEEDILMDRALSESSAGHPGLDRSSLAANSMSERARRGESSLHSQQARPWSSADAPTQRRQQASMSPPAWAKVPISGPGKAAGAPADAKRRLDRRSERQLKKDKATGLLPSEDRARLGSLAAQIAELQQSIEELRVRQPQEGPAQHHSSRPADADTDDVTLDILTLAQEDEDLAGDEASSERFEPDAKKGLSTMTSKAPRPESSQDEAGWKERSLADHLADASQQPHHPSGQLLRRLGTMEIRVAEARSAAHASSPEPNRLVHVPDDSSIPSDAWMDAYRSSEPGSQDGKAAFPARAPLADISKEPFLSDFQRQMRSAARAQHSWPRWMGPRSKAVNTKSDRQAARPLVSKPFEFEQRASLRPKPITQVKLEQDLALRAAEDRAARQGFRAKALPISSIEPRYAAMMAAAKTRREEGHVSRQDALASLARPFTFYDADVEKVRAKRLAAAKPPPKPSYAPFRANPIPATTLEARFIGLEAERLMRKARASNRAKLLLESSAAPARMAEHLKRPATAPNQNELPAETSDQQQHQATAHPVPDFPKLHASWERRLHQARIAGQRPPTAPQDTRFAKNEKHASRFHAACIPPEVPFSPKIFTSKRRPNTGNEAGSLFWSRPTRGQQLRNDSIAQRISYVEWLRQLSQSYGRALHFPGNPTRQLDGHDHHLNGQPSASRRHHHPQSGASAVQQSHRAAPTAAAAHPSAGSTRLMFTPGPHAEYDPASPEGPAKRNKIWGLSSSDGSSSNGAELGSVTKSQEMLRPQTTRSSLSKAEHPRDRLRRDTPAAHVKARHYQAKQHAASIVDEVLLDHGLDIYSYVKSET
ncbi:hypothetical protein WJX74_005249 [Apatococcus lobatus]|uniref:Uncharacterized protein n=1 Tax=Apatococcus lobatus TaxID=904363 RepID=A0AAW1RC13_9CHLO